MENGNLGKMLDFAGIIMRESSSAIRRDLWFEGADEVTSDRASLQACKLIEQAILVDTPVCVIGKFDSELGGLVNDLMVGGLQVIPEMPLRPASSCEFAESLTCASPPSCC